MKNSPNFALLLCILTILTITLVSAQKIHFEEKPEQMNYRTMVHAQNLEKIAYFQKVYGEYYTAGPTPYTHLTDAEFAATYLGGIIRTPQTVVNSQNLRSNAEDPTGEEGLRRPVEDSPIYLTPTISKAGYYGPGSVPPAVFNVNWNYTNATYVTSVKSQGGCGSCWAFAGIGEIQSYFLYKHKLYLDLSEQQMVDCVPLIQPSNLGCGGGYLDSVGLYAVKYAVATERNYPYIAAETGSCVTSKVSTGQYMINNYVFISDCNTLANTLLNTKPIGVCMTIDNKWSSYVGGVIPDCNSASLGGHCVLLVGAASDGGTATATNYWTIKNSWGTGIGEYGFFRLYRDPASSTGICGMCGQAIYSQ